MDVNYDVVLHFASGIIFVTVWAFIFEIFRTGHKRNDNPF